MNTHPDRKQVISFSRMGQFVVFTLAVILFPQSVIADNKVTLLPQWIPQAQFAGYMIAVDKGFYKQAGIDVTLLTGGPQAPALEFLRDRKCNFATGWVSTALQQRDAGVKLVNFGQIVQRSAVMLIARKSSGIKSPADFQGKKLALWGGDFRIQPMAFFMRHKLNVEIIPLYATANLFVKGGVDAMSAMWYNEYHQLLLSGLNEEELQTFFFSDLGLNFPEDGFYCLEETYIKNPQLCGRLVEASIRGWLYAFDHEEEALDIVMKYANAAQTGTNRAHQRWMLERMRDLILPGNDRNGLGKLKESDYRAVSEVLKNLKIIREAPAFSDFYRGPK
jgi:NitT/TauT family transport system substrate-binding protein